MATIVSVDVDAPTTSELLVAVTVNVDPVMRTGTCDDCPLAVATIVAVRVVAFAPAEKVTVALPVASLTALDALRNPLSAEKVMVTPETAAFEAFTTVAVIVAVLLLSDATEVAEVLTLIAAAVGAGVTGVTGVAVLLLPDPPPPQAPSSANSTIRKKDEIARDEFIFNLCSCCRWGDETCRS